MFVLIQNFHIPTVAMLYRLQLQNIQDHHQDGYEHRNCSILQSVLVPNYDQKKCF